MARFLITSLLVVIGLVSCCYCGEVEIDIIHTNDVHARIDEFDAHGSRCTEELRTTNKCYGGIARQKYLVDQIRNKNPNRTIFLNGGDYYQGSMWFFLMKAKIIADTLKFLKHDAMTLGNHEFDDGSQGLVKLLESARDESKTPILACNIDFSNDPILKEFQPKPSMVLERENVKIGVIGFITPETDFLSKPDNGTVFTDEIECIQREAEKLKAQGVNIIITLGHSGYLKDQEIAEKVPLVSVVVGAHSHTYLSSVDQQTGDFIQGPYPTVVDRKDGTKALVVQDFWLGKYLGYIKVKFDTETGMVKSWEGNAPILLDHTIPKDEAVETFLNATRVAIDKEANTALGKLPYSLTGDKQVCRAMECAVGNLLSDAVLEYFIKEHLQNPTSKDNWRDVDFAVVNGGGIRGTFAKGDVSFGDVVSVYPFDNRIDVLTLSGKQVKRMFENSVAKFSKSVTTYGGFLQVSGVKLIYNMKKPPNSRLISAKVLSSGSDVTPTYVDIEDNKAYRVAMTTYIADGGDGHSFPEVISRNKSAITDTMLIRDYFRDNSPLYPRVEGRILLLKDKDESLLEPYEIIRGVFSSSKTVKPTITLIGSAVLLLLMARFL